MCKTVSGWFPYLPVCLSPFTQYGHLNMCESTKFSFFIIKFI